VSRRQLFQPRVFVKRLASWQHKPSTIQASDSFVYGYYCLSKVLIELWILRWRVLCLHVPSLVIFLKGFGRLSSSKCSASRNFDRLHQRQRDVEYGFGTNCVLAVAEELRSKTASRTGSLQGNSKG
jgi:hypothetical protein